VSDSRDSAGQVGTSDKPGTRQPEKQRGIFQRDGRWWISWYCTEGHRHRQPIGSRKLAIQEHGARRKEVEKARRLGVIYCPDEEWKRKQAQQRQRVLFREIAQDFLDFAATHKRDRCDKFRMERLLSVFGENLVSGDHTGGRGTL